MVTTSRGSRPVLVQNVSNRRAVSCGVCAASSGSCGSPKNARVRGCGSALGGIASVLSAVGRPASNHAKC